MTSTVCDVILTAAISSSLHDNTQGFLSYVGAQTDNYPQCLESIIVCWLSSWRPWCCLATVSLPTSYGQTLIIIHSTTIAIVRKCYLWQYISETLGECGFMKPTLIHVILCIPVYYTISTDVWFPLLLSSCTCNDIWAALFISMDSALSQPIRADPSITRDVYWQMFVLTGSVRMIEPREEVIWVHEGQNVTLKCIATQADDHIVWYHNHRLLHHSRSHVILNPEQTTRGESLFALPVPVVTKKRC